MGDYYNTTRGPLSLTLNDGTSCVVSPKAWIYVTAANEMSASIVKLVQKGFLRRAPVARTVAVPAPVSAPVSAPVPVSVVVVPVKESVSAETVVSRGAVLPGDVSFTSSVKEEIVRKKR